MKKMKTKLLLIGAGIFMWMMSCRKGADKPVQEPDQVIGKLAKMEYTDGSYDFVFYNADASIRMVKIHSVVPGPYDEIYRFAYDGNGRVTRITDNIGEYYDYTYQNGVLAAVSHYVNGTKRDYCLYDYQNGKLSAIEEYYKLGLNTPGYEYTALRKLYYYADGNLKTEENYSFDSQTHLPIKDFTVEHLDYDGNFNPEDGVSRFLYQHQLQLAKNNPRRMTTKDEQSGMVSEFIYEYTYNAFSNPLTKKLSYTISGQLHTETIKYYYY